MTVSDLPLEGLKLVQLDVYGDSRGFFAERFHEGHFQEAGLPDRFAQDNHSRSAPDVLRGLHYQYAPRQGKLVGVTRGRIWDVAVDIRGSSSTFGKHFGCELSDLNGVLLWIPAGFAHGFCVLGDEAADVYYKVDAPYSAEGEGGIQWNDPHLAIPWPIASPVLSSRDRRLDGFEEYRQAPRF